MILHRMEEDMVRSDLHQPRSLPDALARAPARPHLDAVAWNAARAAAEARVAESVAVLLSQLADAAPARRVQAA